MSKRSKETRLEEKFLKNHWKLGAMFKISTARRLKSIQNSQNYIFDRRWELRGRCLFSFHTRWISQKKRSQIAGYKPLISSPSLNTSVASMPRTLSVFFFFFLSFGKLIQRIDYLSNFLHYIVFLSLPVSSFAVLRVVPEVQTGHWQARPDLTHLFWTAGFPGLHWSHLRPETNQVGNFKVYLIL